MKKIYLRIRDLRKKKKVTQQEVAEVALAFE